MSPFISNAVTVIFALFYGRAILKRILIIHIIDVISAKNYKGWAHCLNFVIEICSVRPVWYSIWPNLEIKCKKINFVQSALLFWTYYENEYIDYYIRTYDVTSQLPYERHKQDTCRATCRIDSSLSELNDYVCEYLVPRMISIDMCAIRLHKARPIRARETICHQSGHDYAECHPQEANTVLIFILYITMRLLRVMSLEIY